MLTMVRRFIQSLYARLLDEEVASRVAMTAHELMDNAIRHAIADDVFVRIEIVDDIITIRTRNRADQRDIATLRQALGEMDEQKDPLEHYLELMARTAHRAELSGLGLGRIWAEADMTLSYEAHADLVSVCAQLPIHRGTP